MHVTPLQKYAVLIAYQFIKINELLIEDKIVAQIPQIFANFVQFEAKFLKRLVP